ncbi:hypothetical protein DFP72DRAFT_355771 [Ephemerocybe angulata]|uniref:Uncharacterized protein n=1 Tax=Ephemerocybe angulata TaxID=980116 RepID=A0A8H6M6P6_9AGAR|nr:hypothetical protein DFP72DRAFT_355771 [Tulosesus angulatus]
MPNTSSVYCGHGCCTSRLSPLTNLQTPCRPASLYGPPYGRSVGSRDRGASPYGPSGKRSTAPLPSLLATYRAHTRYTMVSKAGSKPTYAQVASRSPSPVSSRASSPLSEVPDALPPQLEPPFTQAATKVDKGKGRKKATPAKRNAASKVNNEVGPPPKSSASTGFVTKFTPGGGTIEVEVDADVASAEDTDEDAGVGLDPDDSMYQDKAPRNRVKPVLQSIIKTRASNAKSQASSVPAATSPPTRSPGKRRRARTSTIASNSSGSSDNDVAKPSPKRSRCSTPVDDGPLPDMECDVVTDRYEADDAGSDMDVADVDMDVADVDASDCEVDEEYEAMDVQPEEGGGLSDSEGLSDGMASPTALVTTLRSDGEDDYDVQDPFIDDAAVEDVDCITDDASLVSDQDDGEVVGVELSGDKASAAGPNETALPDMAVYPPSDDEDVAPGPSPTPSPRVKRTSSLSKLATKPHEIPLSPAHLAPPPVGAAEPHPPSDDEEVVDPAPSPASSPRPKRTSSSSKPAPKSQPKPSSPALLAPPPARASQRNPPRDDDEGSEPAATPASAPRAKRTSSSSKPATKLQDKRASAAPLAPPPAPAADTQPPSDDEEGIVPAPDPTPTPKAKRTTSSSKPTTNPQVKHAPSTDIAPPPARASEVDPPSVKVEVVDPVPAPTPSTKTKRKSSSSKSATRTRPSTDDGQSTVQTSQPDPSGDPSGSRSKPDVDSKPRPARVSSRNAKPQHSGPPTAPPTTTVPPAAKLTAGSTQKSRSRTAKVTPVATSSAASEVVRPSPPPHLSDNVSGSEETPVAPPAPVAHERKRMTAPTPYADLSKPSPSKKQTTSDTKNVPSSSTSSKGKHKSPTGSVDKQTEAAEVLVSTASSVPVEAGPPVPETAPSEPTKKPVPPKKPRRTFQSVVSKSASGPSKRTGLVGDAYFHKTRTLPDVCQVTDPDLQDPELAQFYAGLPPLLKGYFKLWTDIQGDGYMCFSNWVEYCPDLDFE